ncbi:monocarboxylate transporter 14 [Bombyx mori]|uniref:Major facilitator superfamily (MFS) profile domain-containing protein n=1 Tax=Bombyx mori TaxID=7091 RepID=A0A8R2AHT4_BOMMO|nr:monocarboxylate transporter 14 [Bombyx mori]
MEDECGLVLKRSRTPRSKDTNDVVRESLLSESTSGFGKGEEDTTSIGTTSFSSPDLEISSKEAVLFKFNDKTKRNNNNHVKIIENPADEDVDFDRSVAGDDKVSIPDGGWGWVVVFSSFVISMIADGISFSFGLLYIEFLEEFQASKSTTAWIGSLFIAVPLLSGPVMSALVDRYGCRSMTILGGIISTLGFVLASISTTLEMMMITFGVIAGLGLGLVYVTAVVSIAYWFEKKRNLAVGLGACGTGVGTFVYAPMTQYFIDEYGWRGTILLLSGTLLNLCVCGCVMRDPEWWIIEQKRQRMKDMKSTRNSSTLSISNHHGQEADSPTRGKFMEGLIKRGVSPETVIRQEAETIRQQKIVFLPETSGRPRSKSVVDLPTYSTQNDKISLSALETLIKTIGKEYEIEVKYPKFALNSNKRRLKREARIEDYPLYAEPKNVQRTYSDICELHGKNNFDENQDNNKRERLIAKTISETKDVVLVKQDSKENKRDWLRKQLSVNHHYLKDLKMPITSISHRNAMLNIRKYKLKASSCPDIFKNSMITINEKEEKWYADCVSCVSDMFNVSLFKRPTFNLLCLGTIIIFVWFIVPYFYLAEHMTIKGYTEDDGALMLSLIGITNTIGMVGLGWIGDFPNVSIGNLYAVCLVLCGASVAAIPPAVANYWVLAAIACAFGLLFAASFTFTPSLLVKLVSLDDFTSAYGLVLLAQGIGHLIGPPLSGLIFDLTNSWELSFYLSGGWIMAAGVLISFIQPVQTYYQRRRNIDDNKNSFSEA